MASLSMPGNSMMIQSLETLKEGRSDNSPKDNFKLAQQWLVDSLDKWLVDVRKDCLTHIEGENSYRPPPNSVASVTGVREDDVGHNMAQPFNFDFQDLLIMVGTEHQRELEDTQILVEELRADNDAMKAVVRQQARTLRLSAGASPEAVSAMLARERQASQHNSAKGGDTKSSGPSKIKEALQEACDIFLDEAPTAPSSPLEFQDHVAGEFWAPIDCHSASPIKHSPRGNGSTRYAEANDPFDLLQPQASGNRKDSFVSNGMPDGVGSVSPMDALGLEGNGEMDQDMKAKAGTLCTLFGDGQVQLANCFHVWSNMTKQMRKLGNFPLREAWVHSHEDMGEHALNARIERQNVDNRGSDGQFEDGQFAEEEEHTVGNRLSFLIIHPSSSKRLFWDLAGAVLLFSDLILIPMQAFSPDFGLFTLLVDWVTLIFWSLDMCASCGTGYQDKGDTIMNPVYIMGHYLKTWFVIDAIVVFPDWIFNIIDLTSKKESGGGAEDSSKLLRTLRIVRILRLLRLVKLKRIAAMIRDRIDSEIVFICINILKLIAGLLAVNHFLASLWYLIGDLSRSANAPNWLESEQGFHDADVGYRYTTAMHWSLTQFTPASMSVQPTNVAERTFAITVLVVGLVLFSSFISNITTSMTQLRTIDEDKTKQFWLLRRFLRQHGIHNSLSYRVLRYLEYATRESKDLVSEQRVWIIKLLSDQLKNELKYVVSYSCMMAHPLFERTCTISSVTMHRLGSCGLSMHSLAASDLLFNTGSVATHMHIIVSGDIQYVKAEGLDDEPVTFGKDDWFCEATLYTPWVHLGTGKATTETKLVNIEEKEFSSVITMDVQVWDLVCTYAANYMRWLNSEQRGKLSDAVRHCEATRNTASSFLYEDEDEIDSGLRKSIMSAVRMSTRHTAHALHRQSTAGGSEPSTAAPPSFEQMRLSQRSHMLLKADTKALPADAEDPAAAPSS